MLFWLGDRWVNPETVASVRLLSDIALDPYMGSRMRYGVECVYKTGDKIVAWADDRIQAEEWLDNFVRQANV